MNIFKRLDVAIVVTVIVAITVVAIADALGFGPSRLAAKVAELRARA